MTAVLTPAPASSPAPVSADPARPLLDEQTTAVQALIQRLRAVIVEVVPSLSESVHLGWGALHYCSGNSMRGLLVAILPRPAYVNLEFRDGVDLPDPQHRLEGTGKRMRHVKLRSLDDVDHPDVRALLRRAARLRGLEAVS